MTTTQHTESFSIDAFVATMVRSDLLLSKHLLEEALAFIPADIALHAKIKEQMASNTYSRQLVLDSEAGVRNPV